MIPAKFWGGDLHDQMRLLSDAMYYVHAYEYKPLFKDYVAKIDSPIVPSITKVVYRFDGIHNGTAVYVYGGPV